MYVLMNSKASERAFSMYVLIHRESSFRSLAVNQIWFLVKLALHNIQVGASDPFTRH